MHRRLKIAFLLAGTILGYGSAIRSAHCHARARHARFEHHVASLCADAAKHPDQAPPAEPRDWPRW